MSATLVLDVGMQPVGFVPWEKAITYIIEEKAEYIEWDEGQFIRSQLLKFPMPLVVRIVDNIVPMRIRVKFSRKNIHVRDRCRCAYCGHKFPVSRLTLDHVVPRSRGGKTTWENTVSACGPCNMRKDNRTPEEARMPLRVKPIKPLRLPRVDVPMPENGPWKKYWDVQLEP